MPPKADGPPRPKKVMTPEMLEKLAAARAKANVARAAMKSDNDELKLQLLQRKMDAIKKTTTKAPKPEIPEKETENESVNDNDNVNNNDNVSVPELMTEQMPDTVTKSDNLTKTDTAPPPASPVKAIKKTKKKPVVIVENSDSDSDDDNSNVIYIRRKSKSKTPQQVSAPPPPEAPKPQMKPVINPFFSYYYGSQRNFQ